MNLSILTPPRPSRRCSTGSACRPALLLAALIASALLLLGLLTIRLCSLLRSNSGMATVNVMDNGSRLAIAAVTSARMLSSDAENVPRPAPSLTTSSPVWNCTGLASDAVVSLARRRSMTTSSLFGQSGAFRSMDPIRAFNPLRVNDGGACPRRASELEEVISTFVTVTPPTRSMVRTGVPLAAAAEVSAGALRAGAERSKFVRPAGSRRRFTRMPPMAMYVTSSRRESSARGTTPRSTDFTLIASP